MYCNQYSVFLRQASYTLPYNSEVYNCNIRCLFNYMEVSKKIIIIVIINIIIVIITIIIIIIIKAKQYQPHFL